MRRYKYLVLTLSIFFVLSSITIVSKNNNYNEESKFVMEKDNSDLLEEKYNSNLITENDNNTVTKGEEEGSIRVSPDNEGEAIMELPNPNIDGVVILKRL